MRSNYACASARANAQASPLSKVITRSPALSRTRIIFSVLLLIYFQGDSLTHHRNSAVGVGNDVAGHGANQPAFEQGMATMANHDVVNAMRFGIPHDLLRRVTHLDLEMDVHGLVREPISQRNECDDDGRIPLRR